MRIVHVSDLHFGNHSSELATALENRIKSIEPDVIVATGDLADEPFPHRFKQAQKFLTGLASSCKKPPATDAERPNLIVIPGNHDMLLKGFGMKPWGKLSGRFGGFYKTFEGARTDHFFQPENVWVFGFDSADKGKHSGGEVRLQDLERFHRNFDELSRQHGKAFEDAFKIAVVHHHPLPVNWDKDWKQRWLTMLNSGQLLAAVLHRRVDLVLHGHEHLQARARLKSTLGGETKADFETTVVSLGATLRKVENPNTNWFNVVTIEPQGAVRIESYSSEGLVFSDSPVHYTVRSSAAVIDRDFTQWISDEGFCYRHMASITSLNPDGDAHRIVECDLEVLKPNTKRSRKHEIEIPHTSGDIQLLRIKAGSRSGLSGISIKENPPIDLTQRHQSLSRTIDFGKSLAPNDGVKNYQYSWWSVDAFAMDDIQYAYKYPGNNTDMEFTHIVIQDPVENLLLVVQFPDDFEPRDWPEVRVTKPDPVLGAQDWERMDAIEDQLNKAGALRYIESLHTASLRIRRPQRGFSYGIQWSVPKSEPVADDSKSRQISQVAQLLLGKNPGNAEAQLTQSQFLLVLLRRIAQSTRDVLLTPQSGDSSQQWKKSLEISLMVFDPENRKLMTVKAGRSLRGKTDEILREIDYSGVSLEYGDGIAGKAFKTNEYRLYVRPSQRQEGPTSYRMIPGSDPWVLLSLPIRTPTENGRPYGVINIGSNISDCPLAGIGESSSHVTDQVLSSFRKEMDQRIFDQLTGEMLNVGSL